MDKTVFEPIPKLERAGQTVRTVVLSTDENFVPPAGVMISSLLEVSSPGFFYDIVVLDNGIAPESRDALQALTDEVKYAEIRFWDMADLLDGVSTHGLYSKAAYLTVFIPYLFRTHEVVLYLDCDMIVRKDVSELFKTKFENNEYVAVTRDVGIAALARGNAPLRFKGSIISWRRYAARIGFSDKNYEDVFNAGMLVYNIPAFVADDFAALRDASRHVRFGYLLVDQCVLNILLRDRIKYVHMRWNFQVQNWGPPRLLAWFADEYREAEKDPAIIHYITHLKPWASFDTLYAEFFWRVARWTAWFQELCRRRITESFLPWINRAKYPATVSGSEAPLFSIIMPVYNRAGALERTLRSIRLQKFTNFELLIIDDASTDDTAKRVEALAKVDSRIRLIRLEKNGGPGPARNAAIEQARGHYIRICDSDDYYPPEALAVMAKQIERRPADLIAGNLLRWHSRLKEARPYPGPWLITRDVDSDNVLELQELWSMLLFHRCAFRREFLMENHIRFDDLRRGEDPAFMASVLSNAKTFSLIQDVVYLFHVRPREHRFTYQDICNEYSSHELIIQRMKDAGLEEAAYCHAPFSVSYKHVSREEALKLAEQLIQVAQKIPLAALEQAYFKHPDLDVTGLRHDLLVVQNASPQQVVELMNRGLLCEPARKRNLELQHLERDLSTIERLLNRAGLSLGQLARLKNKLMKIRAKIRRAISLARYRSFHRKNARWEQWRNDGRDLPNR